MRFMKEEKEQLLKEWQNSGKSAWAYAKEKGLCPQTFNRWVRANKGSKARFVELPKKMLSSIANGKTIVIEKGEVKVHVPLEMGHDELRTIIDAIGSCI